MMRIATQIYNAILKAEKILLVSHKNPDGDAVGSLCALMEWLDKIDKEFQAYNETGVAEKYLFLPHSEKINSESNIWNKLNPDLIISLDTGDTDHSGITDFIKNKDITLINIDHHTSNTNFGHLNLVIPHASSSTTILHQFFIHNKIDINKKMALALLTGIVTDTHSFTNAATNNISMNIASELVKKGANLQMIQEKVFRDQSMQSLKVWGEVFLRMDRHKELDIVYTHVTKQDIEKHGATEEEIDGIANFMNNIGEGKAHLILKEMEEGLVKASFRTTRDDLDVSSWAKIFGGGGHKKAAGFSIEEPIENAVEFIFAEIEKFEKNR